MKSHWLNDLIDLFYPQTCMGCNNPLLNNESVICLACQSELPKTNFHNIRNNVIHQKFTGRYPFEKATSYLYFSKRGIVQSLIHNLKYKDQAQIGELLGRIIARDLHKGSFFKDIDIIVPIPLYKKRLEKRGYNQSEKLAEGIASVTNLPISDANLIRPGVSESQTRKSRFDRWKNVKDAFTVNNPLEFRNKHLLLLDDVVTTGSTIEGAASNLKDIQGIKLSVLTLAFAS